VFAVWEVIQQNYFQDLDHRTLHYLYITRGIALAFLLATWAACIILAYRRSLIAQLRRSEMKYRQLIEEARDAMVVVDRQGIVHEWNPQASRLFGYTRDEVIGRSLPTVLDNAYEDFFALLDNLAVGREEYGLKYASQRLTKQGEVVDVSLSLFPLRDERGKVTSFLETSCDIRSCAQMIRKLQQVEKMSGMGQLAAGVAHQLNTPLGSALIRAQMLEEDVQDQEQIEELRFIQQQLRYGKEIVEGLLRFSRPSEVLKRHERLNPILQGVLRMMEPSLRSAKIRVLQNTAASERAMVYIGRNELEQVFFNLSQNALDAMPHGGELTVDTQLRQDRSLVISFRDNGTGISQARLARIFEPFYTTKEPGKGTGLGLAICRRIIEDAGGTIEATSELGQGATFTIHLPVAGKVFDRETTRGMDAASLHIEAQPVGVLRDRKGSDGMA
jgi:two-component system sporulation sensor kinase A/two-component system, sporulation sensor kinase E